MLRFTPFVIVGLFCASVFAGGSIFDDDYKPPPGSTDSAPKELPRRSYSPPAAKPAPRPKEIESAPTPPPRSTESDKPSPQPATLPSPLEPLSTSTADLEAANRAAELALAEKKKTAEEAIAAALAKSPDYAAAVTRAENAKNKQESARRSDDPQARIDASKERIDALSKLNQIHDSVIKNDPAARAGLIYLASLKTADAPTASTPQGDRPPGIADAIRQHTFVEGMTLQEACRSARIPFKMVWQSGGEKIYRWDIKGTTGTTAVQKRNAFGRYYTEQEPVYGLLAYVEARFVDNSLVEYGRFTPGGITSRKSTQKLGQN